MNLAKELMGSDETRHGHSTTTKNIGSYNIQIKLNVFNKMSISDVDNNNDCSHRSPITIKPNKRLERVKKEKEEKNKRVQ